MKGLKSLKKLGKLNYRHLDEDKMLLCEKLKDTQLYKDIEKELKALEIIRKYIKLKKIGGFPVMELDNGGIYTMLRVMEEYDLLKEVLGNE